MIGAKHNKRLPTISSIVLLPFLATIAVLLCWLFFRIGMFTFLFTTCYPLYEYWFGSSLTAWPLAGAFALTFLLLFAWNASLLFDPAVKSGVDRIIVALNATVLMAIGYTLFSLSQTAELSYLEETEDF